MRAAILLVLVVPLMSLIGCGAAHDQAPSAEHRRARAALVEAEREGAHTDRLGAMYLALARSYLDQAERRLSTGDWEGARGLLLRAEVDAEMAALVVREATLRDAARRTLDEVGLLAESLE